MRMLLCVVGVLLCLERAIERGSAAWAVGAGVAFALLTLATQPQWTFYAGLFTTAWTLGGIYLENTIPHPVGTRVTLRFTLPGDEDKLEVRAEVAAAMTGEEEFGMGLKFVELDGAVAERIQKYIARTGG